MSLLLLILLMHVLILMSLLLISVMPTSHSPSSHSFKTPLDSTAHKSVLSKRETSKASIFRTPTAKASLQVANEIEGSKKKNSCLHIPQFRQTIQKVGNRF
ncbi:uncharacterized protein DS421_5g150850 [Arachis hypogaea]|nr:uncharacterized protein DS421_5g150850 [Arachis hypogaea]